MTTTMTNATAHHLDTAAPPRSKSQTQVRALPGASVNQHTELMNAPVDAMNQHTAPLHGEAWDLDTPSDWITPGPVATNAGAIPGPDPLAAGTGATVGSLLGNRYLLESVLGEGGMGVVFRATDTEFKGETFAIKVLRPAIQRRTEALRLLREEVRKARSLKHPNIVGVYSLNSDPSGAYVLMEYLEGKSLSALIQEKFGRGMPLMRAWPLIHDIGSALAYAHDHNVIHSDLKPSNLFVTVWGRAMLLDFGVARAVHVKSDRFDTRTIGASTPAYASNEMLAGNKPDQSDDVYAFACVIYEMLSGKHPFNGQSAAEAKSARLKPRPLAVLTHRQNQALSQALSFQRSRRTASVEALLEGLKGPGRSRWRSRAWLGFCAAACIVAGTAVGVAWRGPRLSTEPAHIAATSSAAPPADTVGNAAPAMSPTETAVATSVTPATPTAVATQLPNDSAATAAAEVPETTDPAVASSPKVDPAFAKAATAGSEAESEDAPPLGKKISPIIPSPGAESKLSSCPYPQDALRMAETGTVGLLVYVSPSGNVTNTRIDSSSGSPSLDQAAANCVRQFGQFAPRLAGRRAEGHWGRLKFNWSFGG